MLPRLGAPPPPPFAKPRRQSPPPDNDEPVVVGGGVEVPFDSPWKEADIPRLRREIALWESDEANRRVDRKVALKKARELVEGHERAVAQIQAQLAQANTKRLAAESSEEAVRETHRQQDSYVHLKRKAIEVMEGGIKAEAAQDFAVQQKKQRG